MATVTDPYRVDIVTIVNGTAVPFNDPYQVNDVIHFVTPEQKLVLDIHYYAVIGSVVVIALGGLYAGAVAPIITFTFQRFNDGFAHKSRIVTVLFSLIVGVGCILGIVLPYTQGLVSGDLSFLAYVSKYADYWSWHERLMMPTYLFWYIYGSFAFNLVLCSAFALVARWDAPLPGVEMCSERHGFVIVTHNSTWKLREPVEAILKFAKPHQIFIADNGSSATEQVTTRELCAKITDEYYAVRPHMGRGGGINVAHLRYGNKTLAQYACVYDLVKRFDMRGSTVDIVTLIDDDVFIPPTFSGSSLERQFFDPSKVAIAYPLRIANAGSSTYATLQDAEYFTGNVARYAQDHFGSQLFASGAVATWKIHPLLRVLERHCTAFNGEDLEMGYLLHKLCDAQTDKLGVSTSVRIGFEPNVVVPTTVPVCLLHGYDLLPGPLKRRWGIKSHDCGEASFFSQRLRSWDPACHAYIWKFVKIIFSPRGTTYGPKAFIRVLCLWKLISILREYMLVFGIVFSFARISNTEQLIDLGIFYADSIVVSWAFGILCCWSQSWSTARQGMALRPDVVFSYPILLELPYGLIIRPISAVYSFAYYLWACRAPPSLKSQIMEDAEKRDALHNVWADSRSVV